MSILLLQQEALQFRMLPPSGSITAEAISRPLGRRRKVKLIIPDTAGARTNASKQVCCQSSSVRIDSVTAGRWISWIMPVNRYDNPKVVAFGRVASASMRVTAAELECG